ELDGADGTAVRDGLEAKSESLGCLSWRTQMTKAVQKITLSPSRDIPFNKLVLSQSNVRRVKVGISIEQHPRLYAYDDDRHRTGDQQGRPPARARARID